MAEVKISNGELVDKLTILMIKNDRIADPEKLKNINVELDVVLEKVKDLDISITGSLVHGLREVNEQLWDIEDAIREMENYKLFNDEFIEYARSIYVLNDKRAEIKRKINEVTGSDLIEEKSYRPYKVQDDE